MTIPGRPPRLKGCDQTFSRLCRQSRCHRHRFCPLRADSTARPRRPTRKASPAHRSRHPHRLGAHRRRPGRQSRNDEGRRRPLGSRHHRAKSETPRSLSTPRRLHANFRRRNTQFHLQCVYCLCRRPSSRPHHPSCRRCTTLRLRSEHSVPRLLRSPLPQPRDY